MMTALAQLDREIDQIGAARAEEQRRLARRDARPSDAIKTSALSKIIPMQLAQFRAAYRADLLGHLEQNLQLNPSPPRSASTAASAGES